MATTLEDILNRMQALQAELEAEIERLLSEKREQFQYQLEQGKVRFDRGVKALQRRYKVGLWSYITTARVAHVLSAPVIYSVFLPFVFLDLVVTLYQHVCFRVYGIPRVVRSDHIVIDRHHLAYLNIIEKINCIYCGYANGLVEYVREVSARTEQYWCPIKHAQRSPDPHRLSQNFVDYGDMESYKKQLRELREEIRKLENGPGNRE